MYLTFLAIYAMFVTYEFKWFRIAVAISAVASLIMARFVADLSSTTVLMVASIFIIGHLLLAVIDKRASLERVGMGIGPLCCCIHLQAT